MTTPVITVTSDTSVRQVVSMLLERRISGVLAVDEGRVGGVIGDGDLLRRHEIGTDQWQDSRTWWQRLIETDPGPSAYVNSHGGLARDVMNCDVRPVQDEAPIADIAALFESCHIRRVPVLRGDELVGIVTRSDVMRALAAMADAILRATARSQEDEAIRRQLCEELARQSWWSGSRSDVFVHGGIVNIVGVYEREIDKEAAGSEHPRRARRAGSASAILRLAADFLSRSSPCSIKSWFPRTARRCPRKRLRAPLAWPRSTMPHLSY